MGSIAADLSATLDIRVFISRVVSRWKILSLILLVAGAFSISSAVRKPSYRAISSLWIYSTSNSVYQSITNALAGAKGGTAESQQRSIPIKYEDYLNSFEFYVGLSKKLATTDLFKNNYQVFGAVDPDNPDSEALAITLSHWVHIDRSGDLGGQNQLFLIADAPNKEVAVAFVNWLAHAARDYLVERDTLDVTEASRYLQSQMNQSEDTIARTEELLASANSKGGAVATLNPNDDNTLRLQDLKKSLNEVVIEIEENKILLHNYQTDLKRMAPKSGDTSAKYGLPRNVSDLEKQIEILAARKRSIERLVTQLASGTSLNAQRRAFDLKRRLDFEYSIFQELKRMQFQLEIERISVANRVGVFELARHFNVRRSKNAGMQIVVTLFAALSLSLLGIYFLETLRPKVNHEQALKRVGVAIIGHLTHVPRSWSGISGLLERLGFRSNREVTEIPAATLARYDLARLRDRLSLMQKQEGVKVISVISAQLGEGKSFVMSHLAGALGRLGQRVLIVDTDSSKADSNEVVSLDPQADWLSRARQTARPGVDLLTFNLGGTSLFARFDSDPEKFKKFLERAKAQYAWVLIDTPPVALSVDPLIMASHSDATLMVVRSQFTLLEEVHRLKESLSEFQVPRVYAVFNDAMPAWGLKGVLVHENA